MKVTHFNWTGREVLEAVIADFNRQVTSGTLRPDLIDELNLAWFGTDSGLVVAREQQAFRGVLYYTLLKPNSVDEIGAMLMRELEDSFVDSNGAICGTAQFSQAKGIMEFKFPCAVAYVNLLESFQARAGVARQLINSVRQMPDVEGIILQPSLPGTVLVYERLGFQTTGVYITGMNDTPIMALVNR